MKGKVIADNKVEETQHWNKVDKPLLSERQQLSLNSTTEGEVTSLQHFAHLVAVKILLLLLLLLLLAHAYGAIDNFAEYRFGS